MNQKITEQKIQAVADKIVEKFQPEKIILFGSWALGEPRPDSDVDLLVVKETENPRQLARQIDSFLFPRVFPIDLLVYSSRQFENSRQRDNFFIREVINDGKILYGK